MKIEDNKNMSVYVSKCVSFLWKPDREYGI